ncbi:unnamed protein product, partial [Arabidopsis halleri]
MKLVSTRKNVDYVKGMSPCHKRQRLEFVSRAVHLVCIHILSLSCSKRKIEPNIFMP